jgi:hypothetical protein
MADRWMDERDRRWRERDWRRSEEYGRGGPSRNAEGGRWNEERSWAVSPEDQDYMERHGGYVEGEDRDYGGSDLTTGGAYGRDPTGARGRYGTASRFGAQDYTGRSDRDDAGRRDYDFETRRRSFAQGGRPGADRDWQRGREEGWVRYGPERSGDYRRAEGRPQEPWREGDYRRHEEHEGSGDFLSRAGERISSWFRGSDLMRGSHEDEGGPRRYREDFGREARAFPEGDHRGRGPRGYKRADERISDEVHDRLTEDPWLDASNIGVEVKGGEVTLSGSVDNREAKHRAERLVENLAGVTHVQNNLRVNPDMTLSGAGRGFGSSALEAEMRRNERVADPETRGASDLSGRTSTGARAERPAGGGSGETGKN